MNDLALSREPAGCEDRLVYRLLLAVDIQGYTKLDVREQLRVQRDLRDALDRAAEGVGLDRSRWDKQAGGDGELAIPPEGTSVAALVGEFPLVLAAELRELNRSRTGRPRLRIRLAVHYGTLTAGPFGPAGQAPIVVQRLLDAGPLRALLRDDPDRELAYAVSDKLYEDVVRTGFTPMAPEDFQPIRITAKNATYRGHIHVGDPLAFADLGELHKAPASARRVAV